MHRARKGGQPSGGDQMIKNLILTGGPAHDYARTAPMIADILKKVGIDSQVREDFDLVKNGSILEFDLVTLYCTRATYRQKPDWTEKWGFELPDSARQGFLSFLGAGKGLLALHAASGCFDDWPEYRQILGAWWEWGHSSHPPVQELAMRVRAGKHPIVDGVQDFKIVDEFFMNLRFAGAIDPLVESDWEGATHPIAWVRHVGKGRVYYNALGHGVEAVANPAYGKLIQRGALWVAGRELPSEARG